MSQAGNIPFPKTLLIGPQLDTKRNNVGGATSSFGDLQTYFETHQLPHNVINTQHFGGALSGLLNLFYCLLRFLRMVWSSRVVFLNLSQNGIAYLAPILIVFAKILGKKVIVRPFGGWLKSNYENASPLRKWLYQHTLFKADLLYLQTQLLIDYFAPLCHNTKQLVTARKMPHAALLRGERPYEKRFLFVGHIKKTKGIDEILAAKKELNDSYTVDLYGPINEPVYANLSDAAFYKGLLADQAKVLSTMATYDVVILPTYYAGEGYPGVIIEAYSLGIPVITTRWKAIPELVEHHKTGLLIEPKSTASLVQAMQSISQENYAVMQANAASTFRERFQVDTILKQVMKDITQLTQS